MAATKYQVLYRYINEATNTAITNSMDNAYNPVCEFYVDPHHKMFSDSTASQYEATNEQQEMISFGNSSSNPKTNMLFAYNGTEKIKHKKWIETIGYVVKDWKQLDRNLIGNEGDFTKKFTTLNAMTPEDGGMVVCKRDVFEEYFKTANGGYTGSVVVVADNSSADGGTVNNPFYTEDKIKQMIEDATIFSLITSDYKEHCNPSLTKKDYETVYYTGPVAIGRNNMRIYSLRYSGGNIMASTTQDGLYKDVTINQSHVETVQIPGHYIETIEAPYLIKDTYKRIKLSPWFVNYTCGSLEAAIDKARVLVDMLGIENVKVIKTVPFDQFVKIK
jgi:hypothetical protein